MKPAFASFRSKRGFTLLELLAATVVLGVVLAVLLQTSRQILWATRSSHAQMDAAQDVRAVLGTLGADLLNRIGSANETLFVASGGSNSKLVFFCHSRGSSSSSNFRYMAVSYQLSGNQVLRGRQEVSWTSADPNAIAMSAASSTSSDVLADGVIRLEAVAVLNDGSLVPLPTGTGTTAWTSGSWGGTVLSGSFQSLRLASAATLQSEPRVRALIVAVAAVHPEGARLANSLNLDLAAKLPSASAGQTPVEAWASAITSGSLSGVPSSIRSALQLSQQIFPLNTP